MIFIGSINILTAEKAADTRSKPAVALSTNNKHKAS